MLGRRFFTPTFSLAASLCALFMLGAATSALGFATTGGTLFDDDYPVQCPTAEQEATGGCNGLFPVRSGDDTQMALLTNGEESFRARVQILRAAKRTISIQALVFRGDESGLYIANLLRAKQAEGVKVRLITDALSNPERTTMWMYGDLMAHFGLDPIWVKGYGEVLEDMFKNGVGSALNALNHRFHDKLWIIDGDEDYGVAIMGGLNIANEYFRADTETPSLLWRDQDVIVRGSVVRDLTAAFKDNNEYFLETQKSMSFKAIESAQISIIQKLGVVRSFVTDLWFGAQKSVKDPVYSFQTQTTDPICGLTATNVMQVPFKLSDHVLQHLEKLANSPLPLESMFRPANVRFLHNRPRLDETYIRDAYIERLNNAETEVLIANAYFLPYPKVLEAIKNAARRGVEVTIITNSPETNDLKELSLASETLYKDLMGAGAHVYEWRGDKHGQGTIHAKFAVFDRTSAIVGSYNLDPRSEKLNSETVLAFENEELATQLANQFLGSDIANSDLVDAETAQKYYDSVNGNSMNLRTFLALNFKGML